MFQHLWSIGQKGFLSEFRNGIFMEKCYLMYVNFFKSTPGPPPSPCRVRIQDSEFTGTFYLIPEPGYSIINANWKGFLEAVGTSGEGDR